MLYTSHFQGRQLKKSSQGHSATSVSNQFRINNSVFRSKYFKCYLRRRQNLFKDICHVLHWKRVEKNCWELWEIGNLWRAGTRINTNVCLGSDDTGIYFYFNSACRNSSKVKAKLFIYIIVSYFDCTFHDF